ncbi:hypothetical protein K469DRAFT_708324 [Zopfia rhizophila CBS 207.26]|uniref:Nucleoside 2-deoxyribosyltransferase domain-containing protein n=1 Tax=Zopfia rhizophila CBS 207.26 TaxID=1314779 RepID=A0A6A6DZR4_9PEZI|nr:hypothetical protein K469DRAFT_708324 [Zopfia rhizophila CBS 207.26]
MASTISTPTTTTVPLSVINIDGDIPDIDNQLPFLPSPLPDPHSDFIYCTPPEAPTYRPFSVFLAGSIEMGKAINWQRHMSHYLQHLPLTVLNPRRGHWDQSAKPSPSDQTFRTQVEWELDALNKATVICFFFDKNTLSPVTLLELGLWAKSGKVVVCCPEGYWKGGNVRLVCEREGVPCVGSFGDLVPEIVKMLGEKGMEIPEAN